MRLQAREINATKSHNFLIAFICEESYARIPIKFMEYIFKQFWDYNVNNNVLHIDVKINVILLLIHTQANNYHCCNCFYSYKHIFPIGQISMVGITGADKLVPTH